MIRKSLLKLHCHSTLNMYIHYFPVVLIHYYSNTQITMSRNKSAPTEALELRFRAGLELDMNRANCGDRLIKGCLPLCDSSHMFQSLSPL